LSIPTKFKALLENISFAKFGSTERCRRWAGIACFRHTQIASLMWQ